MATPTPTAPHLFKKNHLGLLFVIPAQGPAAGPDGRDRRDAPGHPCPPASLAVSRLRYLIWPSLPTPGEIEFQNWQLWSASICEIDIVSLSPAGARSIS